MERANRWQPTIDRDKKGLLTSYRVLDLTDEKGFLCGKVLGDLGADVIKIEKPGGGGSRYIGPCYGDIQDPQQSLYWMALNTNKRGMTLDIESKDGQEILTKLAKKADIIIESFKPGYLEEQGVGYLNLRRINPELIMVSISPFGQNGPYKNFKGSNLIAEAMGGVMFVTGDRNNRPTASGFDFAYCHAGLQGAVGALIALHHRQTTGQGQHVDLSMQEAVIAALQLAPYLWFYSKRIQQREGAKTTWGEKGGTSQIVYPCKDGYVLWRMYTGGLGWQTQNLVQWMEEEGMAADLATVEWQRVDMAALTKDQMVEWESVFAKFLLTKTKKELFSNVIEKGIMVFPLYNASDILQDPQLKARNFLVQAYHPELQSTLTYPGIPFKSSEVSFPFRPSPLIGEHTTEIYKEIENVPKSTEGLLGKFKEGKTAEDDTNGHDSALAGVKVLDLGWVFAGPFVARFLGDYGATVIKIESFNRVDPLRTMSPYAGGKSGVNRGAYFLWHNPNKYSMSVDLHLANGLQLVKRLVAWADVIVENFTPGTLEKLGLGYGELKKINPGIILVRVSSAGQDGPYAHVRALGQMLKGLTGLANTGIPGQIPTPNPVAHTDFTSGYYFTCAALAALDYRRKTGKGQCIDGSQVESGIIFYSPLLLDYVVNGTVETLKGNRIPDAAPHNAYRCKGEERWCVISVFTDEEWRLLCIAIGNRSWATDAKYSTLAGRKKNEDELDRSLESWTIQHTPEQVVERMQAAGIAAGVVKNAKDLFKDPQLKHRNHFRYVDHSEIGTSCYSAPSYRLMDTPPQITMPTPCLGEHTEFVCREILGMDDEEFIRLLQEEVLT